MRALVLMLLAGCSSEALDKPALAFGTLGSCLAIEAEFSPAERTEVEAAFTHWQYATGDSSPCTEPWVVRRGGERLGQTFPELGVITINADGITPTSGGPFRAEAFLGLVLHEMGHAAGVLAHTPAIADSGGHIAGTVMDAHLLIGCIDPVGLDAVCDLRGCAERRATCQN